MGTYRDLIVYKKSVDLAKKIFKITKSFLRRNCLDLQGK